EVMAGIGRERGWSPMAREQFDAARALKGHLLVGSPQQVIDKIMFQREALGHDRFLMQMSLGATPHAQTMRSIELFGTKVAPVVRAQTAQPAVAAAQ
ncbi:MAG: LLM class flavin-dependent oxidoreductase, partial [Rhizobiales bacterium]|nr:LLM class flavin-dependent oxidoreductase [Hyphomicrobiales bacterium]